MCSSLHSWPVCTPLSPCHYLSCVVCPVQQEEKTGPTTRNLRSMTDHKPPVVSPLVSSAFTPGIRQIAKDLSTSENSVIGATTGFVIFLGFGPLFLGKYIADHLNTN